MKTAWAPWRIEYILGEKEEGCVFCNALSKDDTLTLYKGARTMVVMNKFPYINGHLLAAPRRHVPGLEDLDPEEKNELMELVDQCVRVLKQAMKPDGCNVGLNLGKVAGAGVEEHLHFHIVPRWFGDVNALAVFADLRVIPEHILQTAKNLRPFFDALPENLKP